MNRVGVVMATISVFLLFFVASILSAAALLEQKNNAYSRGCYDSSYHTDKKIHEHRCFNHPSYLVVIEAALREAVDV